MKILITGATGFIGSNIAKKMVLLNHEVLGVNFSGEHPLIHGVKNVGNLTTLINDPQEQQLRNIDVLIHQAANNDPQSNDLLDMQINNVENTAKLFTLLYTLGCRKFIYATSTAVYGAQPTPYSESKTPVDPLTPYAYSKMAMEQFVHAFAKFYSDVSCLGMRYCNVYGPGEKFKTTRASMIFQIIKTMMLGNEPAIFEYGNQSRDWVYIDDVVDAHVLALTAEYKSEIINIGSGKSTSFNKLIEEINEVLETTLKPNYIKNPFQHTYQERTLCDISHAKKVINWVPNFDTKAGIKKYIDFLKNAEA